MLIDDCVRSHVDPRLAGYHVRRRKNFSTPKKIEQRFEWLRKKTKVAWKIYYQAMEQDYEESEEDWLRNIRARVMVQSQHHRRKREEASSGGGKQPFSSPYDWVPNGFQLILEAMK